MYNYMPSLFYAALMASISHISLAESSSSGPGSAGRPWLWHQARAFPALGHQRSARLSQHPLPRTLLYFAALASSSVQASSFPSSSIPSAPPTGFPDLVNTNSGISLLRPKTSELSRLSRFHTLLPASHRSFWALPLNYTQNSTLALLSSLPRRSRPIQTTMVISRSRVYMGVVLRAPARGLAHSGPFSIIHSRAGAIALK